MVVEVDGKEQLQLFGSWSDVVSWTGHVARS